jgi:subtilase family serine protease
MFVVKNQNYVLSVATGLSNQLLWFSWFDSQQIQVNYLSVNNSNKFPSKAFTPALSATKVKVQLIIRHEARNGRGGGRG